MYTDLELFDFQQFEDDLKTDIPIPKVFRKALKQGHNILLKRFQAHKNVTNYVLQRAWLIDKIVIEAWEHLCTFPESYQISLIAVGGYGRGEMHPHSDVDLLILSEYPLDTQKKPCIVNFLQFLWDLHLKVGHSVRTLQECEENAAADITVITNLIEARLIAGSKSLFQKMQETITPDRIWSHKELFTAKIEEQRKRYLKYHNTISNLEPNIKESPGGLRDIHMIGWVAKRYFNATTLYDLVQNSFLTKKEYQVLSKAQEFVWDIRCRLHLTTQRNEDRLLFEYQRILAQEMGYKDDDEGLAIEKLMKRYYRTAKKISTLNGMLLKLFQEAILYADAPATVYALNKRFQVHNHFIEVTQDNVFVNYPFALLEIFLLMQEHTDIKGIRATTIRLMIHYNYLIDKIFLKDLRAQSIFIEIFRQAHGLTHVLRRMNSYGILETYIPAFGKIVGQMQYDLFHAYTVDQHTLFVIGNLRRLTQPEFSHEFPFCSKLIQTIPKLELLYLAGFFHDIAKGRGGNHSELGESDVFDFCQTHHLSDYDARLVGWLVRHHLLISTTAQRQDLDDPDVINSFAEKMEDIVHLDYLYLLTVADIRATNPTAWNKWKEALLTTLYHKSHAILQNGKGQDKQVHINDIQSKARSLLSPLTGFNRLWEELGAEYFLYSTPQDVAHETQAILKQDFPIVLEREAEKGSTRFILITKNCDSLFSATTYFLEQQNLSIVDAFIVSTQSQYTISGYTILEEKIQSTLRIQDILKGLKQALLTDRNMIFSPIRRYIPKQLKQFPLSTRITFTQDHIHNHTIMELVAGDSPGLLSRVAQAFVTSRVRLKKAKIATFNCHVEDIFFMTTYNNHALYSAEQLDALRKNLSKLLEEDTEK